MNWPWYILIFIFVLTFIILTYLLIISRGEVKPFINENNTVILGSIAKKIKVRINGIDQGMFIRGQNTDNPVLLFIHGGPGIPGVPEFFLNENHHTNLENYFTVCWWETRGAGLSYNQKITANSITIKQLIDDTISVTQYLREQFHQDKIYLMGHSAGTLIGIQVAMQCPHLYHAYIGMSQITGNGLSGTLSNTLTYNYIASILMKHNDNKLVKKLNKWSIKHEDGSISFHQDYLNQLDNLKHQVGCGTMHNMNSVITGIFLPQMNSKCYTLLEKINYWRGKIFMPSTIAYEEMLASNLFEESLSLDIPIYFLSGIYDYTCPYPLSLKYFNMLDAPLKGFYTFKKSAHSPLWEEPERTIEILIHDVLQKMNNLSDSL